MHRFRYRLAIAAFLMIAAPAIAQNRSEGYKFLEAVKKEDIVEIRQMLDKPGSVVIDTQNVTNGDTPLHVIVRSNTNEATEFLGYLLARKANPNVRDNAGVAPIVLAATRGREDMVRKFIAYKANVDWANSNGETALIVAVRQRDMALLTLLLDAGANPDQRDLLAGMSARDYAAQDRRAPAIAKAIEAAPKKSKAAVAGPKF